MMSYKIGNDRQQTDRKRNGWKYVRQLFSGFKMNCNFRKTYA